MAVPLCPPENLAPLLSCARLGVLTDVDGTISQIATQPEAAFVSPVAKSALTALAGSLPVVACLSGRALADLRRMVGLPDLLYVGSHGLTWWYQGADEMPADMLAYLTYAQEAAEQLAPLRDVPGLRFEDKGVGLALHYRHAMDPDAARTTILSAIAGSPAAQRFEVREGIFVAELYPRVQVNKGTALRRVVERFELDGVLFLGDDLTDADAMYAARSLRDSPGMTAISIAVCHPEAPSLVGDLADYEVEGIAGSEAALSWLAEAVGQT